MKKDSMTGTEMIQAVQAMTDGIPYGTANLANAAAILYHGMENINWAGFYLLEGERLVLGPFEGKPACIEIPVGKGVCGTAIVENCTLRVADVHLFPGHIACDSASLSEIVIPLRQNGKIIGVLDIDSPVKGRFSAEDQVWLEMFAEALSKASLPGVQTPEGYGQKEPNGDGKAKPSSESAFELKSARHLASDVIRNVLREGDTVVDATAGNGYDTCFLAELVGDTGRVYAFDIQEAALNRTEERLTERGLQKRVTLIHKGHERMSQEILDPVRAVMFNLGWFPGGEKNITTRWETTVQALEQALDLLLPLGVCTVCAYPGHTAGEEERRNLTVWLAKLPPQQYNVLHSVFLNAGPGAPECFVIQKMRKE